MAHHVRRLAVSPSPDDAEDNLYSDDDSMEEVDATLNNLDDEFTIGSYLPLVSYTGSPSLVSLAPLASPHLASPRLASPRLSNNPRILGCRVSIFGSPSQHSRPARLSLPLLADKGRTRSYVKLCDFTLLFMILQLEYGVNKDH